MRATTHDALALAGVAILAVVITWCNLSCGNQYATAYRSLGAVRATAALAEQTLTDACKAKVLECERSHPTERADYLACGLLCRRGGEAWVKYVRPSVNSALVAGTAAIDLAYLSKSKPSPTAYLSPVACALSRAMSQWVSLLPASVAGAVRAVVAFVDAATCPKEVTP